MKQLSGILALALLVSAPAAAQTVQTGETDWSSFPRLKGKLRDLPTPTMVSRIEQLLADKECRLPGQEPEKFNIDVPFVVLLKPDGSVERLVVKKIGCPQIEAGVANVILERAARGDFRSGAPEAPSWYGSEISFVLK